MFDDILTISRGQANKDNDSFFDLWNNGSLNFYPALKNPLNYNSHLRSIIIYCNKSREKTNWY